MLKAAVCCRHYQLISRLQEQASASRIRSAVVKRRFISPASIFCRLRVAISARSASFSWVKFFRTRSRRTFAPKALTRVQSFFEMGTPYYLVLTKQFERYTYREAPRIKVLVFSRRRCLIDPVENGSELQIRNSGHGPVNKNDKLVKLIPLSEIKCQTFDEVRRRMIEFGIDAPASADCGGLGTTLEKGKNASAREASTFCNRAGKIRGENL